jgi:hypothetical protein
VGSVAVPVTDYRRVPQRSRYPSTGLRKWYETWLKPRYGHVYRAVVVDPNEFHDLSDLWPLERVFRQGRKRTGYVGKTQRRDVRVRWNEHTLGTRDKPPQPWIDTLARWEVLYCSHRVSGLVLAWVEFVAIKTYRPLYNVTWNLGNRQAIPPWVAVTQRTTRDTTIGRPFRPTPLVLRDGRPMVRRYSLLAVVWWAAWVLPLCLGAFVADVVMRWW